MMPGPIKTGAAIDEPTPVTYNADEAHAVLCLRQLMRADWRGFVEFIGPVDADVVDPSRLEYEYLLPGQVVGVDVEEPLRWRTDEVLPMLAGFALAYGYAEEFAYRPGLPR